MGAEREGRTVRKELIKDTTEIINKELQAANEKFPAFNSRHEGYAVILEELEETQVAYNNTKTMIERIWWLTKFNSEKAAFKKQVEEAIKTAGEMAAEAIQTAAMLQKLLDYTSSEES